MSEPSSATDPVTTLSGQVGTGTRAERLATALDGRIRRNGLVAGDPIGTFESLRAETGFAYSTVSAAVRLLRDRGVITIRPGRGGGLFVAASGPVVRLRHTLLDVADDPTTVADAIELREHLEVLVDVTAARHRTGTDIAELRDRLAVMESADGWPAFMRANWALHERIADIVPNRLLRSVYVGTLGPLLATTPSVDGDAHEDGYRAERFAIHVELVDAIASGDERRVRSAVERHRNPR